MGTSPISQMDNACLDGLLRQDDKVLKDIYRHYFPGILKFVKTNSGRREDAEDLFHDGLIVMYRKARDGEFELKSSFQTYLFAVCRNLWYKRLRDVYRREVTIDDEGVLNDRAAWDQLLEHSERYQLLKTKFRELGHDCQKILGLFFEKKSMREIAELMELGSESYAKKRKCLCQQRLIELVKQDPRYRELR